MLYQGIQFLLCLTCHISTPQKALKVFAAVDLHFTFQRLLSVRSLIAVRMYCFPAWHLHGSSIKYCHPQQSTCPDKWKSPFLSSFPVNITLPSFYIPPTFISFDLELHTHRLYTQIQRCYRNNWRNWGVPQNNHSELDWEMQCLIYHCWFMHHWQCQQWMYLLEKKEMPSFLNAGLSQKCHHIRFRSSTRLQQTGEHAKTFTSWFFFFEWVAF